MKLAERDYNAGDFGGAVQHFDRAVKLDQSNVKPKLFLANALLRQYYSDRASGDRTLITRARQQYLDALIYDPRNKVAMHGLIAVATELKQQNQAHEWAIKLIQADPAAKFAYYAAAVVDWAIVFADYRQAKQDEGSRMEDYALTNAAVRKILRDRHHATLEEGLEFSRKAVEIDPAYDDAMAYANLLYRLKASLTDDPVEAVTFIQKADDLVKQALQIKRERGRNPHPETPMDVDGAPPGPAAAQTKMMAPPPPPPPPGAGLGRLPSAADQDRASQIASPEPASRRENGEPFWQVTGANIPAKNLIQDLSSKGFHAIGYASPDDRAIRVMVGPYLDKASLDRAKIDLESSGFQVLRVW